MAGFAIAIGRARLKPWGLSPQGASFTGEARVPGRATFEGMDYQLTGMGEEVTTFTGVTYPLVTGGLDMVEWLRLHQRRQDVVIHIRLGRSYLGEVLSMGTIRSLEIGEDLPHPFTGVGRKTEVSFEFVHLSSVQTTAMMEARQLWDARNG